MSGRSLVRHVHGADHGLLMLWSVLPVLLAISAPAAAVQIYSDSQLGEDRERYAQRIEFLLEKGLRPFMTAAERQALEGVVVLHPPRGADPISINSDIDQGTMLIYAPVASIKIVEDLSIAYAWRHQNGYSLEPIDEYLAMLKNRPADDFPGGELPDPLTALGVPLKVWESDKQVDDLSLRFRNSAWAFILAHELGHLRFRHAETQASAPEIQRQEEEADAFAADLLNRSDTIPMGMILWFQATVGFLPNRADYPSDEAYFDWLQTTAQHPVNGHRLKNLASIMREQAAAASDRERSEVLEFIATRLQAMGEIIEDPDMQQLLRRCAMARDPEMLKRLRDQPCF